MHYIYNHIAILYCIYTTNQPACLAAWPANRKPSYRYGWFPDEDPINLCRSREDDM